MLQTCAPLSLFVRARNRWFVEVVGLSDWSGYVSPCVSPLEVRAPRAPLVPASEVERETFERAELAPVSPTADEIRPGMRCVDGQWFYSARWL
jgi:hypothetical protein